MVEKFEGRERLNITEEQTANICPQELPVMVKANMTVTESFKQKETLNSTDDACNLIAADSQNTVTAVCSSGRREEMVNIAEDRASPPTSCLELPRRKMSPTLISRSERKGLVKSKEDRRTTATHNVVVLGRDKAPNSQVGAFERREHLSSKADREVTAFPNVVLRRDRMPTGQVSSSGSGEGFNSKEDQSVGVTSNDIVLGRDKLPASQVSGFERRERSNSKDDQPTRISSRIVTSRERSQRTPPTLGGSGWRKERPSTPEDQAINQAVPMMERTISATRRSERREGFNIATEDQEINMPLCTISVIDNMASEQVDLLLAFIRARLFFFLCRLAFILRSRTDSLCSLEHL